MKVMTKVFMVIGFITVMVCIAGATLYTYRKEFPHKGLLAAESTQNNTSNGTSPLVVHFEPTLPSVQEVTPNRTKRAIIFRPLFVYRQQEVRRQRYRGPATTTTSTTTQRPKYASRYSYDNSGHWLGG